MTKHTEEEPTTQLIVQSRQAKFDSLVFIPALNEGATIKDVILDIRTNCPSVDILVVDDGSDDNTSELARNDGVKVLRLPINIGVGGAIQCALKYSLKFDYKYVFQIDGDGQHLPSYIPDLRRRLESGTDLIIGSRFLSEQNYEMSKVRRFAIWAISRILRKFTKIQLTDPTSGFRGFSRSAVFHLAPIFPTEYLGDTIELILLAHHSGLKIEEIPVKMRERQGGTPSAGSFKSLGYLIRSMLAVLVAQIRHVIATGIK